MSIHTEKDDLKMQRSLSDSPFQKALESDLGDDFELEIDNVPEGISLGYRNGTSILIKKYYVSLAMGESPITDAMVKDRSILYSWANHPMFNIGDGSVRISGKYLFPKKILIDYDRNSVEMDFEMFGIYDNGAHTGYIPKPDKSMMTFEYAYVQDGYKIRKIDI
jgi:hypothetical protein